MKQPLESSTTKPLLLVLTIVLGFIFLVSISAIYVSDAIKNNNACGCVIPVPYMILILSSLGLFIGSLSFYILISKHIKEKRALSKNLQFILNFLDRDEKAIIDALINNNGSLQQSELEKLAGIHRVKVHRVLHRLEAKSLLKKESHGKSNRITLCQEIKELFC